MDAHDKGHSSNLGFVKDDYSLVEAGFWPEEKLSKDQALLLAIIDRALQDAFSVKAVGVTSHKNINTYKIRVQCGARTWLQSKESTPFSYIWCCEQLNMRPKTIYELTRMEKYTQKKKLMIGFDY